MGRQEDLQEAVVQYLQSKGVRATVRELPTTGFLGSRTTEMGIQVAGHPIDSIWPDAWEERGGTYGLSGSRGARCCFRVVLDGPLTEESRIALTARSKVTREFSLVSILTLGVFGRGKVAAVKWVGGRLAESLNDDTVLSTMLFRYAEEAYSVGAQSISICPGGEDWGYVSWVDITSPDFAESYPVPWSFPFELYSKIAEHVRDGPKEYAEVPLTTRETASPQVADALQVAGIGAEQLEPHEYKHLSPYDEGVDDVDLVERAVGGRSTCFRLRREDVDMMYLMGLKEDGGADQVYYIVGGIRASEELSAEGRVRRKGLVGRGAAEYEWRRGTQARALERGGRVAEALNQDVALRDFLLSWGHDEEVHVEPALDADWVAILIDRPMQVKEIVEFLAGANMIAGHIRRLG